MKKTLVLALVTLWIGSFSLANAFVYGGDTDITSQISVTPTGTVTLSADLLSQSIFTIRGWVYPDIAPGVNCFTKTSGFSTPFSVNGCGTVSTSYVYYVTTTNTGTYPDGKLGQFYVSVDSSGSFYAGTGPNWRALQIVPAIDFDAIQYVATSTALFSSTTSSSTLAAIADQCSETGNVFARAICRATVYLFVPNPVVLNQFQTIPTDLAARFPASWFYEIQDEIDSFSTTTSSSPVWTMNLHDIGIGSSTSMGNFLPNVTIFSATTVKSYVPTSTWDAMMLLVTGSIWLLAFYTVYAIGHRLFIGKHKTV